MKNSTLLALLALITFGCSSNPGIGGGGPDTNVILQVGNIDQEGVIYNTDISEISFVQSVQTGDSTFFEATLDLDSNSSADLLFQLVTWTDNTLLTVKPVNGYSVTGDDSDFEIFGTERSFQGLKLFPDGTVIGGTVTIDASDEDMFISQIRNGELIATSLLIWNDVAYLPFRSSSIAGWVGLTIDANGNDIQGMNINTIATVN